jgi:hypothetical protein
MKNTFREPATSKHYSTHRIQDGGIMDEFGKTKRKRIADKKKRKAARESRKRNRK